MNLVAHPAQSMDMDRLIHDFNLCYGCGLCGEVCPRGAITIDASRAADGALHKHPVLDETHCVHCGRCSSVCGSGAISQEKFEGLVQQMSEARQEHLVFFCRKLNLSQPSPMQGEALGLNTPLTAVRMMPQLSRVRLPQGVRLVDVRCTGRIGARTLLSLLLAGVKGVLIFACPPHDCEYGRESCLSALHVEGLNSLLDAYGMGERRVEILFEQPESPAHVEAVVERFRHGRLRLTR
ncbi:hydrogenase iron-sulfur subunit [Fundidesulfovibrio agrisoli]|uniref:hydrogenase iron-sulfur subunit n=1 Tax=Fundidesulfovibrio agrisoli TaxID=2922717 RepID=UPI001FAE135A|nr:hydrogenase iron-sulfur subunit [Fundidesulfovibrio agrisoli]